MRNSWGDIQVRGLVREALCSVIGKPFSELRFSGGTILSMEFGEVVTLDERGREVFERRIFFGSDWALSPGAVETVRLASPDCRRALIAGVDGRELEAVEVLPNLELMASFKGGSKLTSVRVDRAMVSDEAKAPVREWFVSVVDSGQRWMIDIDGLRLDPIQRG